MAGDVVSVPAWLRGLVQSGRIVPHWGRIVVMRLYELVCDFAGSLVLVAVYCRVGGVWVQVVGLGPWFVKGEYASC